MAVVHVTLHVIARMPQLASVEDVTQARSCPTEPGYSLNLSLSTD